MDDILRLGQCYAPAVKNLMSERHECQPSAAAALELDPKRHETSGQSAPPGGSYFQGRNGKVSLLNSCPPRNISKRSDKSLVGKRNVPASAPAIASLSR